MAKGGCHCGAVRYSFEGDPINHSICHCRDCQLASGAPAVAWLMMAEGQFSVTAGEPKRREGRSGAERYFCAECGSGLYYKNAQMLPGLVDVQSATLDDPEAFAPDIQIQLADRIGWTRDAHALPGFDRYPPMEE